MKAAARRVPRQQRALVTVEAILEAVIRILKRDGVAAVTTNCIAEVAGVSIGSVYQYFPDKRAIFVALHTRHVREIDRVMEQALRRSADASLEDFVRALVGAMTEAHATDPQLCELLFKEVPHRGGETEDFATRFHAPFQAALSSRSDELNLRGRLGQATFVFTHMLEALAHGAVLSRPADVSFPDAKDAAVRSILAGLAAVGTRP
jgi:AcrR family transcriptional regulator